MLKDKNQYTSDLRLDHFYIRDFFKFEKSGRLNSRESVYWVLMVSRSFGDAKKPETHYIRYKHLVRCLNKLGTETQQYLIEKCPRLVELKGFRCGKEVRNRTLMELL